MKHFCKIIGFVALVVACSLAGTPGHAQSTLKLDPAKAITQFPLDVWEIEDGLPQNTINAILQTRDGYLWIGTQEGLVRFDGINFKIYNDTNSGLRNNNISALFEDSYGHLWIGTRGGGLVAMHDEAIAAYSEADSLGSSQVSALTEDAQGNLWIGTVNNGVTRFGQDLLERHGTDNGFPSDQISSLYLDSGGVLWIGTRDRGLVRYDAGTVRTITQDDGLPSNHVTVVTEDSGGGYWIGTRDQGLVHLKDDAMTTYTVADGLPTDQIRALQLDDAGSLWIGTNGGLSRFVPADDDEQAGTFTTFDQNDGLSSNVVLTFLADREGSLWIGTGGGGLNRIWNGKFTNYTPKEGLGGENTYAIYESPHEDAIWFASVGGGVTRLHDGQTTIYRTADGLPSDNILSITSTRDGAIWMGSLGHGLARFKDGAFTVYTTADGLTGNAIYALYTDSQDDLWIGTDAGVNRYDGAIFHTLTMDDGLTSNYPTVFRESRDGSMWIGTYDAGLNQYKDGVVAHYSPADSLDKRFVLALYEDTEGTLWVSIRHAGLYRMKDGVFTAYTPRDGLFSDGIQEILEDDAGNLWMSSNTGLGRLRRQQLNDFAEGRIDHIEPVTYNKADGLISRELNGGFQPAGWKSRDGRLWFPTNKGAVAIEPNLLLGNVQAPLPIVLERAVADSSRIPKHTEVSLAPGHKKFEFHYVGLTFIAPRKVRYRYMLEGEDEAWVDAGTRRVAFYNNLPPGPYTFRVQAANSDGVWSAEEASISFHLKPFFYQTAWFWIVSALAFLLLAFTVYGLRVHNLKVRQRELEQTVAERTRDLREEKEKTEQALQQTEAARQEAEHQRQIVEEAKTVIEEQADQLREMDRIKTRFFNNISHEFRTPLTLNIGPLENALTGAFGPLNAPLRRQLEVMLRNARRLLRLINQLLDLSKLEAGRMTLQAQRGNIVDLVEGTVLSFTAFAQHEGLVLDFEASKPFINLYYDPHNLEKVFFNLLSNAIKFTPEGGTIMVRLDEVTFEYEGQPREGVEIIVQDSGQGIPHEELPYIFDRFRQVDGTISKVQEGTGIGLSLVQELVELHGGLIDVESTPGQGTRFTVTLLKGKEHLGDMKIVEPTLNEETPSRGPLVEMAVFNEHDVQPLPENLRLPNGEQAKILLVDDNADIRAYVANCLGDQFYVVQAYDGQDGYEKAQRERPDLIISDVMMPRMNGYQFCRAVKQNEKLSHIPVILLTSKASTEAKIEGLEAGADDYLNKPFNARELFVRVGNLIDLREQQRELVTLNEELSQANYALREANELKSQLLSIASHDMKNPLMAIREFARIIRSELDERSHLVEFLDLIYTSTNQMLSLVTRLLDSAALESGKLKLNLEPINLGELAETVAYRNQKQAEAKQQKILLSVPQNVALMVEADPTHLYDALENLISNAIKYSPYGKTIWVSATRSGNEVAISVRDEGPGLTDQDKALLFGKFQKLSARPTGDETSTGLGLSIVKQIMEMHGGRVWANSEAGQGSTFTIALPYHASRRMAPPREALPPAQPDAPAQSQDDAQSA